jgi:hypothetical protein
VAQQWREVAETTQTLRKDERRRLRERLKLELIELLSVHHLIEGNRGKTAKHPRWRMSEVVGLLQAEGVTPVLASLSFESVPRHVDMFNDTGAPALGLRARERTPSNDRIRRG